MSEQSTLFCTMTTGSAAMRLLNGASLKQQKQIQTAVDAFHRKLVKMTPSELYFGLKGRDRYRWIVQQAIGVRYMAIMYNGWNVTGSVDNAILRDFETYLHKIVRGFSFTNRSTFEGNAVYVARCLLNHTDGIPLGKDEKHAIQLGLPAWTSLDIDSLETYYKNYEDATNFPELGSFEEFAKPVLGFSRYVVTEYYYRDSEEGQHAIELRALNADNPVFDGLTIVPQMMDRVYGHVLLMAKMDSVPFSVDKFAIEEVREFHRASRDNGSCFPPVVGFAGSMYFGEHMERWLFFIKSFATTLDNIIGPVESGMVRIRNAVRYGESGENRDAADVMWFVALLKLVNTRFRATGTSKVLMRAVSLIAEGAMATDQTIHSSRVPLLIDQCADDLQMFNSGIRKAALNLFDEDVTTWFIEPIGEAVGVDGVENADDDSASSGDIPPEDNEDPATDSDPVDPDVGASGGEQETEPDTVDPEEEDPEDSETLFETTTTHTTDSLMYRGALARRVDRIIHNNIDMAPETRELLIELRNKAWNWLTIPCLVAILKRHGVNVKFARK